MKKKHKITLLVIGVFLVLSLMLSSSYALWVFNVSQESTNVLVSDCLELTLTDNNPIGLAASFPMRDGDGVQTTPYTFTIRNICNHPADFQINLETLNTSTIDESFIKADLNGYITEYNAAESIEPTIDGARSAAMLYEDTLAVNGEKAYNLRIWVNEIATQEDVENKTYASKISVKSTVRKQYTETYLMSSNSIASKLRAIGQGRDGSYGVTMNSKTEYIVRSLTPPPDGANTFIISLDISDNPLIAWSEENTMYLYCESEKIYMNPYSNGLFSWYNKLKSIDLSMFDTSKVTSMSNLFYNDSKLESVDLSNFDTSNVTDFAWMFYYCSSITSLDITNFNTTNATNMAGMFYAMSSLTNLDVRNFDTSNVANMNSMFYGTSSLTSLDLSSFNTSKVTTMLAMFQGMTGVKSLDVSYLDTSNVTNMDAMFMNMIMLEKIDVSSLNTSNVTSMSGMFYGDRKMKSIDLRGLDTSKVENMSGMFGYMNDLIEVHMDGLDTSNVTNIGGMFSQCSSIKNVDFSSLNLSKVNKLNSIVNRDGGWYAEQGIFAGASSLEKIYVNDTFPNIEVEGKQIFDSNINLVGGAGTAFDSEHFDEEYARVDDPQNGKPGYFTLKTN